jgi:hypothetical protein
MADDKPLTKKDLESVIQKVTLTNESTKVEIVKPEDIAKPIVDQQKENDLKNLEKSREETSVFQDIAKGIKGMAESLDEGLGKLSNSFKEKGKNVLKFIGIALGAAVGLILAPVFLAVSFFKQLAVEVRFLNKLTRGRLGKIFAPVTNFFTRIGNFFKGGFDKVLKVFNNVKKILSGVTSSGGKLGKFFGFLKKVGSVVKKVFNPLVKGFKTGFGVVTKFAKVAGRVLGKLFLPITILMSVFDFVKGFMRGYSEGGIIGGITEGIVQVFEGLIGSVIRILAWIPSKIAELLGLDNLSASIKSGVDKMLEGIKNAFRGFVDIVVGIFTLDGEKIKGGLSEVWSGVIGFVSGVFDPLLGIIKDLFSTDFIEDLKDRFNIGDMMRRIFAKVKILIGDMFGWVPKLGKDAKQMGIEAQNDLRDLDIAQAKRDSAREQRQQARANQVVSSVTTNNNSPTTIVEGPSDYSNAALAAAMNDM